MRTNDGLVEHLGHSWSGRLASRGTCVLLVAALLTVTSGRARAEPAPTLPPVPATFVYTQPVEPDQVRALLELAGVVAFGFLWYVTTTDIRRNYDVGYSWPVFRKKLLGQAFELDTNAFGTNFVGHPIGGTTYYLAARSNRLSIAESSAIALGGSLLWEFFGEVHEIVSLNDMIVTPLAGIAIAEPLIQLGAFFDRSSPLLRNRILGSLFGPLKSLNDLLDGNSLARARAPDDDGFPRDEWHRFDLRIGTATTLQEPAVRATRTNISHELRIGLSSQLARLPGYDGAAAERSYVFSDANVSGLGLDLALTTTGIVDLDLQTQFAFLGHYYRDARFDGQGGLWGRGTLIALTMGYNYTLHDYDRDGARPIDKITTVQPLGALFEHRIALGAARLVLRLSGGGDFGGVRPYAQTEYDRHSQQVELPVVLVLHRYYFAAGGHLLGKLSLEAGPLETSALLRWSSYGALGAPIAIADRRSTLEVRASCAIGDSPAHVSLVAQRRTRSGHMGEASAGRSEMSLGLELGARY